MTEFEKQEVEETANKLAEAVHSVNNLNKEQIEYLDILFQKLFIDKEFEKFQKPKKKQTRSQKKNEKINN